MGTSRFEPVAEGVEILQGGLLSPNVYLVGTLLVDGVPRFRTARLMRAIRNRQVESFILTHAHGPTQGSARHVSQRFAVPVMCGHRDLHGLKTATFKHNYPPGLLNHIVNFMCMSGPVDHVRGVGSGFRINGFTVIDTPGHSAGHISLWRESDRVLIVGDAVVTRGVLRSQPRLQSPPRSHTLDMELNNHSVSRLADLRPSILLPAHGEPITDSDVIYKYCSRLKKQRTGHHQRRDGASILT